MSMMFRQLKASLVALLEVHAAGRFRVFASQRQGKRAEEFVGTGRTVRVYYADGSFPESSGSMGGPMDHSVTMTLELLVVEPATVDLAVLEGTATTAQQRIAALSAGSFAADRADDHFDEFVDILFQIIMDARNQDLGMAKYTVGSRWINSVVKRDVQPAGEFVLLAGEMRFTASVTETVTGETPIDCDIINGDINIKDDSVQKTGISTASEE
jgi:hypothetical protein